VLVELAQDRVALAVMSPPSVAAHIKNGSLKALGLAAEQRHPAFPDIPTTAEVGLPGFILNAWYGLFAPAATPRPIVDKLNQAMRKVAKMEVVATRAEQLGTVLKDWSPAELDTFVASEGEMWAKVIRENNITLSE
jgi:tripartite-type tricarboxylate transporter receptor subunit TctC